MGFSRRLLYLVSERSKIFFASTPARQSDEISSSQQERPHTRETLKGCQTIAEETAGPTIGEVVREDSNGRTSSSSSSRTSKMSTRLQREEEDSSRTSFNSSSSSSSRAEAGGTTIIGISKISSSLLRPGRCSKAGEGTTTTGRSKIISSTSSGSSSSSSKM